MTNATTPAEYFTDRVVVPEIALLVGTVLLAVVGHLCCPGVGGLFAFVLGGVVLRLDGRMFALIPRAMWPDDERLEASRAALGACAVFTLLLLGVFLSRSFAQGFLVVALAVRALVPGVFALAWYTRFAAEVFPLIQTGEYEKTLEDLDRETTLADREARRAEARAAAEARREGAERQGRRARAVREARGAVLTFYNSYALVLRPYVPATRLQVDLRAAIPEAASEDDAFAGARTLIARLEEFVRAAEGDKKAERARQQERQQHVEAVAAQLAAVAEDIRALEANAGIDPELRDAEVQSLETHRRSLLAQRALMLARAA